MADMSVKQTDPMAVGFLQMRGPYSQMPEAFGKLYGFVGQSGLTATGMPRAVYFTAPDQVPEAEAVWELWAPLAGDPPASGPDAMGLGVKQVPGKLVASTMHKGPYETIEPTYRALGQWVVDEGWEVAGPPEEIYYSDPAAVPPEEYLTEIQFPVRKP